MAVEKLAEYTLPPKQADPPRETLPTMYDLPSENPEDPGLPDEFHDYQPQLLRDTFQPSRFAYDRFFVATDMNLYYTPQHLTWYKRPDWFAVLGVSRLYDDRDLRLSYVLWQEGTAPHVVVELLSPGTENEDMGKTQRAADQPPTKWLVYEQILRVPYYVIFSRHTDELHYFVLHNQQYQEVYPPDQRLWIPEAGVGLGLWFGAYEGVERQWLRCYDAQGEWIPTAQERAEREQERAEREQERAERERQTAERERQTAERERQTADRERQTAERERQRAEQEHQRAERLAAQLRALGIEPET